MAMLMPAMAACAEGTMASWLSPQPGQIVSGGTVEVAIGYNTQSRLKVSALELYVDGQFYSRKVLRTPESRGVCSFAWDTTWVEQGSHNLVVKVFSGDQMISKLCGTGTVGPNGSKRGLLDVRPPVVTFAGIKSGDVLKGVTTVKINAADDSGQAPMVSLLVDDVLKLLKNTPPYSYDLDTATYPDGDHSLKTYAYDGAGNRSDPAVAKVTFRNGSAKPVVTTLSVDHSPATDIGDATITKAVPPSINVSAEPKIKRSAARAQSRIDSSASPVVPAVTEPKAKPKPVAVATAPKPTATPKHAVVSKLESNIKPVLAAVKSDLRPVTASPKLDTRMAAAVPAVRETAHVNQRPVPVLSAKPVKMASAASDMSIRDEKVDSKFIPLPIAAKPAVVDNPQASGARTARAASLLKARLTQKSASPVALAVNAAAPKITERKIVSTPVVSSVRNAPIAHSAASLKLARANPEMARVSGAVPPRIVSAGTISKSDLKRIRVAMSPDLRSATERVHASPAIACPPFIQRPTKARIEKTTIPASGKVKARHFFEKMGGALFWDPATHTVTACVRNMVLEMTIGSETAKVNGHEFKMISAPQLVNNRTVFDAGTFTQACALMDGLRAVGQAPI